MKIFNCGVVYNYSTVLLGGFTTINALKALLKQNSMEQSSENFLLSEFEQTYTEYRRLLDEGNQRIQFLFTLNNILFSGLV